MRLERILSLVYSAPWAILPSKHEVIRAALDAYMQRGSFFDEDLDPSDAPAFEVVGSVAVVPIEGVILGKCSTMETLCGAFSLDTFKATLKTLSAREDVQTVILNISSGGGTITGLPEAAQAIQALAKTKSVIAYTDSICASAAYWIASNADRVYLSESAELGSIGVYCSFLDQSASFAQQGLKVELFKGNNSEFKAQGFPGTSLSDAQKADLQASVDKSYNAFVFLVKSNRPKVSDEAFSGKMFDSEEAVSLGLADGVVNELDSLIDYLNAK